MHTTVVPRFVRRLTKIAGFTLVGILFLGTLPESASAVSSWSPTLLVNTESFQTIDSGDGTTDIELRFGSTANTLKFLNASQKFQFTKSLSVVGSISGSSLTIDGVASVSGALTVKGATTLKSTLGVTGNITTDANLTINNDADSNDAVLTFGNTSGNQTLKFLNASQKFQFTRGLSVVGILSGSQLAVDGSATISGALLVKNSIKTKGSISGSTLTVDGNITLHGVTYNAPSAQGAANTVLKNDGAGNLTWSSTIANGSGGIISMHPDYPGAIYIASGSNIVGQLTMSGGTVDRENSYAWTTSRGSLQSYWISVRVRLPDNFSSWDAVKPIELRYKTGVASAASNALRVVVRDTAGANVGLTGASGLASTSWTTAKIKGPEASGTWTPKGYFTVYVEVAATNAANAAAYASYLNLNFESTNP